MSKSEKSVKSDKSDKSKSSRKKKAKRHSPSDHDTGKKLDEEEGKHDQIQADIGHDQKPEPDVVSSPFTTKHSSHTEVTLQDEIQQLKQSRHKSLVKVSTKGENTHAPRNSGVGMAEDQRRLWTLAGPGVVGIIVLAVTVVIVMLLFIPL